MRTADDLLVSPLASIRDAMLQLDRCAAGTLLLVDAAGALLRTVTDGDLRRLLVAGAAMDAPLRDLPARNSTVLALGASADEAYREMQARRIDQIPVLDTAGRPVGVFLRKDIDKPILLSSPHMGEYELEYVKEAFSSNWIAPLGPNVDAFEAELAAEVGIGHAAALSSGTAAIHLGLRLLNVERGDRVYCSSLTFAASAFPITYLGAEPVFIDSDPETWNLSPRALEQALAAHAKQGRLPKAVIVVSLYGQSADMDPILALCDAYGVPTIEDAAESLGASYKGRASGTFGRIGVYSFNGNKIITTSGGGMLVSNDADLVARARKLATQARDNFPYYEHTEVGYNYRMSNILAGVGRGQLRVLKDRVAARRAVYRHYHDAFARLAGVRMMPEADYGSSNCWLSCITLDPAAGAPAPKQLIDALARERIEARHVWKPMHLQPVFADCEYVPRSATQDCAAELFAHGVCLPSGSNMTAPQVDRVIDCVVDCVSQFVQRA
jgi:dTDP-4-amino-4,6-dideoxygalactose transaminase